MNVDRHDGLRASDVTPWKAWRAAHPAEGLDLSGARLNTLATRPTLPNRRSTFAGFQQRV